MNIQTIILGGGCFWSIEATMQQLQGVEKIETGYANGNIKNPNYRLVSNGDTGFAEVVKVYFNTQKINLQTLIHVFMTIHNPSVINKQGADFGTQYRSVIVYNNESQYKDAKNAIKEMKLNVEIVLEPLKNYYKAEEYHQGYYNKNQYAGYCVAVINPQINNLKNNFSHLIK
ncbi:MAG: peptide-methionine (S)-S-oxide reductase MsrA [Chitinophagaceae bacterium]